MNGLKEELSETSARQLAMSATSHDAMWVDHVNTVVHNELMSRLSELWERRGLEEESNVFIPTTVDSHR